MKKTAEIRDAFIKKNNFFVQSYIVELKAKNHITEWVSEGQTSS